MADTGVAIVGVGVLTGLGQTAQSYAAMRAGFSRMQEFADIMLLGPDEEWDPRTEMRASPAALAWPRVHPWDRVAGLALPALDEALASAKLVNKDWKDVSLHLALRAPLPPDTLDAMGAHVLGSIHTDGGLQKAAATSVLARGHASGALAIRRAVSEIASGERVRCVVGGIDGFADDREVERLDKAFRLRSERAADGYLIGEAAAFLVLERAETAAARGAAPLARIREIGLAEEPCPLGSADPSRAEGLCEAVRAALTGGRPSPRAWIVSDQNGERHRAREWALTTVRLDALVGGDHELWHPAQNFGDTGAASVPLLAAMTCEAFARDDAPASTAVLLASSDGPERAALVLGAAKGAK